MYVCYCVYVCIYVCYCVYVFVCFFVLVKRNSGYKLEPCELCMILILMYDLYVSAEVPEVH